jgi:phosphonoacetaldehyde hydrolase
MTQPLTLQAAVLDWAGTVVDHGSRAPMGAFVRAFAQFGVAVSIADARGPMGMAKWEHFACIDPKSLNGPGFERSWSVGYGPTAPTGWQPADQATGT